MILVADHDVADGILRLDVENLRDDEVRALVNAFEETAVTPALDRRAAPAAPTG
jgi:hypothetical protein